MVRHLAGVGECLLRCSSPSVAFLMVVICVFTDLFLSVALIMEKEEFDLLELLPRKPKRII